jgi:hypothetical protein
VSWLSKQLRSAKKRLKSTLKSVEKNVKKYALPVLALIPGPLQIPAAAALAVQGVRSQDRADEQAQDLIDVLSAPPLADTLPVPVPMADPAPPELVPEPIQPPPTVPDIPSLLSGPIPFADFVPQYSGGGIPVSLPIVPPGGFFGFAQQTPAAQRSMGAMRSRASGTRKRRRKAKKAAAAPRRRRRSSGNKFTKGSAAAKRHMAKLRAMRKR